MEDEAKVIIVFLCSITLMGVVGIIIDNIDEKQNSLLDTCMKSCDSLKPPTITNEYTNQNFICKKDCMYLYSNKTKGDNVNDTTCMCD